MTNGQFLTPINFAFWRIDWASSRERKEKKNIKVKGERKGKGKVK